MTKKRIAIIGTRGIPNRYGGFEQFAEQLSYHLYQLGFEVFVYNPHQHPYSQSTFNHVNIIRKKLYEKQLGHLAHLLYDYACLKDSIQQKFDAVVACGYGSMLPAFLFLPLRSTKLIINMDGLEWKRKRWHSLGKLLLKISEKTAVGNPRHILVTDHPEIQRYLQKKYNRSSHYIPYGANIPQSFNQEAIAHYGLSAGNYFLLISRPIAENNIHTILSGFAQSNSTKQFVIITNINDPYTRKLIKTYRHDSRFVFLANVYEQEVLNNLRYFSAAYFHGHSVGGTNPSLLEAMASQCLIMAHDNVFNKTILKNNAYYFSTRNDIRHFVENISMHQEQKEHFVTENLQTIATHYQWGNIAKLYAKLV